METPNFNKEILAFNKNAVKMSFDALNAFSSQAAVAAEYLMGIAPYIPEEGKKAVGFSFKENQKGLANLKKYVESGMELDWTTKDAPVKSLDAIESFYKDAFSQAVEIKKEARILAEKATKQLPREAKSIVDFWSDSVNGGFEIFQNYMTKNFELAKKIMADVAVAAPATEQKAAK